jgi:hypothetical protein
MTVVLICFALAFSVVFLSLGSKRSFKMSSGSLVHSDSFQFCKTNLRFILWYIVQAGDTKYAAADIDDSHVRIWGPGEAVSPGSTMGGLITLMSYLLQLLPWMILLGYVGVIIFAIHILKIRYFTEPNKKYKYVTPTDKKRFSERKKMLRSLGPLMFLLYLLAYTGIWYINKNLPEEYIHLAVLWVAYTILSYANISIKEETSQMLSESEEAYIHETGHDVGSGRRALCGNAVALLVFCILYTQLKSFPFYGIWGIIAWTGTLLFSYPLYFFTEKNDNLEIIKGKKKFVFIVLLSWILVVFWLEMG